jgi:MoxR-like ATPase
MNQFNYEQSTERVQRQTLFIHNLLGEINKVMVGQEALVERVLIALLADGHILLEGVPGLAKTLLIKTVAQAIHANFSRVQFTPDLLPADLMGTQIYSPKTGEFSVHVGPIFTNFLLADEINRAPAKVQSALLEAMQERQVTIADKTFQLDRLFLVLATQNPIEQEGTYPLPEAQVDRFMMKVVVDYPTRADERTILDRMTGGPLPAVQPVVKPDDILRAREHVRNIYVDDRIKDYVLDIITATRFPERAGLSSLRPLIEFGASPRAGIFMIMGAKAYAYLKGRGYVTPDDIKHLAPDILRHRVITTYEAEAENINSAQLVQEILNRIDVP